MPGPNRGVTSVALATIKGGEGKTTSVITLGSAFSLGAMDGLGAVILVDCDPQGNLGEYLSLGMASDLADALSGNRPVKECLVSVPNYEKLFVIRGGEDTYDVERLFIQMEQEPGSESLVDRLRAVIGALASVAPKERVLVFLDTAPSKGELQSAALAVADYVLCPMQAEFGGETGVNKVQGWLRKLGASNKLLGVIPQRVRPDSNEHTRTLAIAKRLLGALMYPEIRESEEMSEAIRTGVPIWSYVRKRTDVTADYRRVFDRLAMDLQFVRKSGDERSML